MRFVLACIVSSTVALSGCKSTVDEDPILADAVAGADEPAAQAVTGFTVSEVSGTQPNGQPFQLRQARRSLWLYETGDMSVSLDVEDVGDTFVELVGISDWTGRIKIDLAAQQVEVGDRDWSSVTRMPIQSAN